MSTTRVPVPPHSSDAEKTVLGALLIDPEAIYKVAGQLAADDFYDPTYKTIFQAIHTLMEKGTVADFVTVSNALKEAGQLDKVGGSAFLAQLAHDVPTTSHITQYAEIIIEKSKRRRLAELGRTINDLANRDNASADELIETAEQAFLKLSRQGSRIAPVAVADMRSERFDTYVRLFESDDPSGHVIRTGYRALDEKLMAFSPGDLIVLAGRPGMGKSVMALDIARDVAVKQDRAVLFLSLEMSSQQVFDRLFAAELPVEAWKLSRGQITRQHIEQMGAAFDRIAEYPLYLDDDCNTDLVNIRSKARRHQLQHGLDLLIIDYLQLIEVTDRLAGENQTQRITYISKSLKRLARELRCPVLALSQLSRECDRRNDKRPQLSDLRDSGSIEQDADKVLMLFRQAEYDEDCDEPDRTEVLIRKQRNGPLGEVELTFDRKTLSFVDR